MRVLGKVGLVAVLVAGGVAPAAVAQAESGAFAFQAYHGLTVAQYAAKFQTLRGQGYRPIMLNVSEGPRYATVWTKGTSSSYWSVYRGMSAKEYKLRLKDAMADGMRPVSISATGPRKSAEFTTVFEKGKQKFFAWTDLTYAKFAAHNKEAVARGYVLTDVDVYGTADDVRYVGIWTAGSGAWEWTAGLAAAEHKKAFEAKVGRGYRPTAVAVGPDGTYAAAWRKDGLRSWAHYIEMSGAGYQKRHDGLAAKGLYPVSVNRENGSYAAIWVK